MAIRLKDSLHATARKTQRGFTSKAIELITEFGDPVGDGKVLLPKKAIQQLIDELNDIKGNLLRLAKRNGAVVVEAGGDCRVTVYGLEDYKHA
jgi:hypothetical protein